MQKKPAPQENQGSNWESNLKKQARQDMMKKVAIWGGIILACLAGLAILIKFAGNSGPSTTPTENDRVRAVSSKDIIIGNPKAQITFIEYADFQCPACAAFNPIVNQILENYPGKVRVAYRFFPLTNIHKNSHIAGQAGYAAWKLGKFPEMKDELFTNQADWENLGDPRDTFTTYAKSVGIDSAKFVVIMNSDEAKNAVNVSEAEALGLGLNSTPSFFIGKKQFTPSGASTFTDLINAALKSPSSNTSSGASTVTVEPTTQPLQ